MTSGCGRRHNVGHSGFGSGILAAMRLRPLSSLLLVLMACDASAPTKDAGADAAIALDASPGPSDAALLDAGLLDAALVDAGPSDAAAPVDAGDTDDAGSQPPVGTIEGACGVLGDELTDTSMPFYFDNAMHFDERWTPADSDRISEGARQILIEGTAGGSSGYSEAFAFEVLHRCEGADLVKSETQIDYDVEGPKTDMLVRMNGLPIGVSVTRAVNIVGHCSRVNEFPVDRARSLLEDKLEGVAASSANVSEADRWVKQVLFVWADTTVHAESLRAAWETIDDEIRGDTVVFVTVSEGTDDFIYHQDACF